MWNRFLRAAKPKLLFYGIGINEYRRSALRGCVNDVRHMVGMLEPLGYEAHTLLDQEATHANMTEFIKEGVAKVGGKDILVLHYSGHGSDGPGAEPDQTDECLVSVEMKPFWDNELGSLLANVHPLARVVVVLDCCHSHTGTRLAALGVEGAGDSYRRSKVVPTDDLDLTFPTSGISLKSLRDYRPVIELSACESWDVTYDAKINGDMQGCYTRALIDAYKALELETASVVSRGFNYTRLHTEIRNRLPSQEYPNKPQAWMTAWQGRWRVWHPSGVR